MSSMSICFDRLERLSSCRLVQRAEGLLSSERRHVALLIAHLSELENRKLHLELGFSGLFDYCVKRLRLSEGSAWLRIQVAKVCRKVPALLSALAEGRVSLTVAGKLAPHLTPENCETLLDRCEGMTKREVEEYLARLAPKREVSSGIRKRPETSASAPVSMEKALPLETSVHPEADPTPVRSAPQLRARIEPCRPEVYNVRFAASKELKDKLERLAEVMGVADVNGRMAEVLEKALDIALEKTDPEEREKRRAKRQAKKSAELEPKPRPDEVIEEISQAEKPRNRYVSPAVRDQLLVQADHRCEYVSRDGVRCSQRTGLAIDHIVPHGRGGPTDESNLRVLCSPHNLWYAEQCYGPGFVRQKIASTSFPSSGSRP